MYVPFSREEINTMGSRATLNIIIDVTKSGPAVHVVTLKTPEMMSKIVTFNRLSMDSMIGITNFKITQQKKEAHARYKHMYLTLALRHVLKWAKDKGPGRLAIYSKDQSMAEIFLDSGMKLRKSEKEDRDPLYRGSIEFKMQR